MKRKPCVSDYVHWTEEALREAIAVQTKLLEALGRKPGKQRRVWLTLKAMKAALPSTPPAQQPATLCAPGFGVDEWREQD